MEIKKVAIAGTLESSDVQVIVEPQDTLQVSIESSVMNQYGLAIQKTVDEVLEHLGITSGKFIIVDKGALDCTLRARIQTAIYRSNDLSQGHISWGKL
ncbi:citrate lyase subunit gamma [Streptococcus pseudoporcinus]|uniref:Citrate lyase acyl carrier protein n=1 Tax=Streptococcus pseudoporcinus TaxID=361101 RepID=A0A4U9XLG5_9STRE|nr:citrate lyase acyl carrier protein [Streptococcus pseudoporcinus]VTS14260.1 citrate lyase subunit gamma [Streptococcus pseudoporcinus]